MELAAKIEALEEEISILKGEIKAILQEVRTAVLARENPFVSGPSDAPPPASLPAGLTTSFAPPEAAPRLVRLNDDFDHPPRSNFDEPPGIDGRIAETRFEARDPRPGQDAGPPAARQWSVQTLATLMAWTQEITARLSEPDLAIVLALARYGGMIDADLEKTLAEVAGSLGPPETQRRAGMNDFLLALRQLDALLEDELDGRRRGGPARRAA